MLTAVAAGINCRLLATPQRQLAERETKKQKPCREKGNKKQNPAERRGATFATKSPIDKRKILRQAQFSDVSVQIKTEPIQGEPVDKKLAQGDSSPLLLKKGTFSRFRDPNHYLN